MLTKSEKRAIRGLRDKGYAVVVFTPEELKEADADHVCEIMIERGWDAIGSMNDDIEEECDEKQR